MIKVTIELPNTISVETGKTGKAVELDLAAIAKNPDVIKTAALNGFISSLNDVSRGKDDDDKPNTDAVWQSMREKRSDPWYAGEWSFSRQGAGAGIVGRMREAYLVEMAEKHEVGQSVIAAQIKKTVKVVFGDKETATFPRFLDAIAKQYADANKVDFDDIRQQLETKYRDKAIAMNAARSQAADLDLSDIQL